MIIGTIALLTILFGGGLIDTFFVDKLDKAVKECVVDTERQKDIRADIKSTKKYIKQFNKGRKTQFKALQDLLASRTTTSVDFDDFYANLNTSRVEFQNTLIDNRLALLQKVEEDEWTSIVSFSGDVIDQREEKIDKDNQKALKKAEDNPDKATKKAAKAEEKQPFFKTRHAIIDTVNNVEKQKLMLKSLDDIMKASQEMERQIRSINVKDNDVIVRWDASREDLQQLAQKMNKLRRSSFKQLVQTHMVFKENTDESQWKTILKALNKDLNMAVR